MGRLRMEFRCQTGPGTGTKVWHWCRACRFLPAPGDGVLVRRLEPGDVPEEGDLCPECTALGERMGCGLILLGD